MAGRPVPAARGGQPRVEGRPAAPHRQAAGVLEGEEGPSGVHPTAPSGDAAASENSPLAEMREMGEGGGGGGWCSKRNLSC